MREGVTITLALVVIVTSIFLFFSQEFGKTGRKIFSIPGVKLLLPLTIASLLIELHEPFFHWLMVKFKLSYHHFTGLIAQEFDLPVSILNALLIFVLTILPIACLRLWEVRYNRPEPRPVTIQSGLFIWIILAILLIGFKA